MTNILYRTYNPHVSSQTNSPQPPWLLPIPPQPIPECAELKEPSIRAGTSPTKPTHASANSNGENLNVNRSVRSIVLPSDPIPARNASRASWMLGSRRLRGLIRGWDENERETSCWTGKIDLSRDWRVSIRNKSYYLKFEYLSNIDVVTCEPRNLRKNTMSLQEIFQRGDAIIFN